MGRFKVGFGLLQFSFNMGCTLHGGFFGFPDLFEVGIFCAKLSNIIFEFLLALAGGFVFVFFDRFALDF